MHVITVWVLCAVIDAAGNCLPVENSVQYPTLEDCQQVAQADSDVACISIRTFAAVRSEEP